MAQNVKVDNRARNWACVVYPESAPENWKEILSNEHTQILVSPLHDKDVDPQNQPKKPHYHVIVMYEGKKSPEQIKTFFSSFCGVGQEVVKSIRGYARYLCHLDNPEKAQYSVEDVSCFGGVDYLSIIDLPTDKYKSIKEMMEFCRLNNIVSYSDLLDYCAESHFDWFRVLCDSGTLVMKEYLKSRSWSFSKQHELSEKEKK